MRPFSPRWGDATRLGLVEALALGSPRSIAELTQGSALTRQAVTKHLVVLERAGIVRGVRRGRERRFELAAESLRATREYLEQVSTLWDQALGRLKVLVEKRS